MKNNIARLLFLVVFGMAMTNCQQDEPQPKSASDVIWDNADLSFFRAALDYTGLKDAFKTGALTVFAPNDAAFKASGYASIAAITALPVEQVQAMLKYHVIPQKTMSASIADGNNQRVAMFSGDSIYLSKNTLGISLNGVRVTQPDLEVSNGVVHIIDKVLTAPKNNLAQVIQANPDLSLFWAAYQRATVSNTNPALLTAPIGYTVFVPNNKAMEKIGLTADVIKIRAASVLLNTVLYHFSQGRNYTTTLVADKLQMLGGNRTVGVKNTNGVVTLQDSHNTTPSKMVTPNILATNGVVHVIDQVLDVP